MSASVQPKIAGLDVLEFGIRTLKRSKLLVTPEYKDMLCAVERHHNDLRLAHLTGKAKDLLEQAQRDTKFYNILVKMLCEVKEKRTGEQRQGLRKVYTWYMANKHVLFSGPHFGKAHMKKEAHEVIVKATTPRKPKTAQSRNTRTSRFGSSQSQSSSATQRDRAKSAPSMHISWKDSSFDWRKDLEKGVLNEDHPQVERLNLHDDNDEDNFEPELQRLAEDPDIVHNTPINTADTATTANTDLLREARMLSRAHHGSPTTTLTPLGEQSPNVEMVTVTPRKMVHPISSMVNPHVTLAVQLEQERQEKLKAQQKVGKKQSRADSLQAWQNFNKSQSYGQDIVDRLNFVGRSGTPNDVRYFAHGQAEMPELYTSDVITGYAQVMAAQSPVRENGTRQDDQKENVFAQRTLEEFYEMADSLYPTREFRPTSRTRVKSAPASGRKMSSLSHVGIPSTAGSNTPRRRPVVQPNKLGHLLQDFTVEEEVTELRDPDDQTSVKLDTVVNIIDAVSEEMTLYKERLAPEAQAGFRQPMATGLPTGPSSAPSVRLPSPVARSNSPVQGHLPAPASPHTLPPRPYSTPLVSGAAAREREDGATPSPRQPKDRCKSAGVIDWRGRVQPDTMRYKWSKTKFGGYTYLKKHLQKPVSLRSAGSTSAGKRPKTAPVSIRDKWKTDKASDANNRVEGQAASHSMTQINQQDVDSMVTVQYLMGSSNSRADSLASLYSLDEEFLRSLHRRHNVPTNAPLEYMSFVSSSPASLLLAERHSKSRDKVQTGVSNDRQRPELLDQEVDHFALPPNLEGLHIPLGLDIDIPENIHDDDDSIAGEAGEEEVLTDDRLEKGDNEDICGDLKEEEILQADFRQNIDTSDVAKTTLHDPVEVTSHHHSTDIPSEVLPSPVITAHTELTLGTAEVSASILPNELTTVSTGQVPVEDSSEVTPSCDPAEVTTGHDLEEVTPGHDPAEVTPGHDLVEVTPVHDAAKEATSSFVSTQVCIPPDTASVPVEKEEGGETEAGAITYVTTVTPDNKPPLPISPRQHRKQPLSVSQVWQFSPSQYEEEEGLNPGFILGPRTARTQSAAPAPRSRKVHCSDCITMASSETVTVPKIQRSAGRMPGQTHSASSHMLHLARRHDDLMRRAPPPRTPPSIPVSRTRSLVKGRAATGGPVLSELEHHARKVKSPRALMQHGSYFPARRLIKDLRSGGDTQEVPPATPSAADSLMSTLQVCRLQVPLPRPRTVPLNSSGQDQLHSILKPSTTSNQHFIVPHQYTDHDHVHNVMEAMKAEKAVSFSHRDTDPPPDSLPPESMPMEHFDNGLCIPTSMTFMRQMASGASSLHSSGSVSLNGSLAGSRQSSEPGTPSSRNLARMGRPIAQVVHVPDPGEVAVAVQKQREAAAAVDIQRIFRGYVARNVYKSLLSEERQNAEDKRRAAVEIQRRYRGHLGRRRAIERRPPSQEMLEWARNYRSVLITNEQQRQAKTEERAEELADNYHSAQSKLAVIGPHVNIYEIYHPKKTGPSKKELNVAAIAIQRWIRGWLIRRRFNKLERKAAWYGSTLQKLVKEYKAMLSRVQRQHSVNNPTTPFTTHDMNDYIDTRRRFESLFEKKSFGGELELVEIPSFFKECDLYPSHAEIDEALDVAVRGVEGRGLKRQEMLDMVFYIYTPPATGLVNTRQSTWMNPIIDGVEAKRLIGSEFVEDAPLEVCARLVIESRKERRQKEQAEHARREEEEKELLRKAPPPRKSSKEGGERERGREKKKEEK
ncbi:uncharacterized protein LOC143298738 isoform X2 [Babylonia areolata]|uniref:uncharacterized protein LOC143298738 isoform X2 n=1 Tax=Babylonia areolata TaxID=304850 RepID=UPI003FD0374F